MNSIGQIICEPAFLAGFYFQYFVLSLFIVLIAPAILLLLVIGHSGMLVQTEPEDC